MAVKCCRCGVKLRTADERHEVRSARTLTNRAVPLVVCADCAQGDHDERQGRQERQESPLAAAGRRVGTVVSRT